jgi:hypothetical protein
VDGFEKGDFGDGPFRVISRLDNVLADRVVLIDKMVFCRRNSHATKSLPAGVGGK